ncbi:hypothetical protein L218DRAFT_1010721 [Marasmius fiardii PR-910]|nr:hypothetical protein L218DRAFT_1010721 [Marasmius fiardii PR-910]
MQVKKNKYLPWHTTPFPLYDDILYIITGKRATGEGYFVGSSQCSISTPTHSHSPSKPLTQIWEPTPPCTFADQDEDEDDSNMSQEASTTHYQIVTQM